MTSSFSLNTWNYRRLHQDDVLVLREIATDLGFRQDQEGEDGERVQMMRGSAGNRHTFDHLDNHICRYFRTRVIADPDSKKLLRVASLTLISVSLAAFNIPESISKLRHLSELGLQYGKVKPFFPATMRSLNVQLVYHFLPPTNPRMANSEPSFSGALVNDGRTGNGIDGGATPDGKIYHSKQTCPNITTVWMMGKGRQNYDGSSERYFRQLFNFTFSRCRNIIFVGIVDNNFAAASFVRLLDDMTNPRNNPSH